MKVIFSSLLVFLVFISCSSTEVLMQNGEEEKFHSLEKYVKKSETLNSYFYGVQLYDIQEKEVIFEVNQDHFFTPASLTKWITFYTSTHFLKDSIAWLNQYKIDGQTVFQPMGDPTFLHPDFETEERISSYFENFPLDTILWSSTHFQDTKFGSGWAWDDYEYYYQTEKSAFPIHSNLLRIKRDSISPTFIASEVYFDFEETSPTREWDENRFFINMSDKERFIPFVPDSLVLKNYFVERYKVVSDYSLSLENQDPYSTIYSLPSEGAYKILMQKSDNHIAEQLLLQASQLRFGKMNTEMIIKEAKEKLFAEISDELQWVDGSGLSRYNMVTPNAIVTIINKMVEEKGLDYLQNILPAGGQSGTLKNYYDYQPARVFAKTGTLRHNHNLAGIVQSESGKWYSFCIMNNHFSGSSIIAKKEMENMLKIIIENY